MSDSTRCPHWHLISADSVTGQDTYAYSEADEFDPDECPTVKVTHGHGVICDPCRQAGLEAIVRDLAARDDTADEDDDGNKVPCIYCGAEPTGNDRSDGEGYDTGYMSPPLDEHEPGCIWRRAREWVEAHPETDR
jgi:hypothetical protein